MEYATVLQLLELLAVEPPSATDDVQYVLRDSGALASSPLATGLFGMPEVQDWLLSRSSSFLFVRSTASPYALFKVSPFTVVCSTLALSLDSIPQRSATISFFCGLHSASSDPLHGPVGLLRSLVPQLLVLGDAGYDLSLISSRRQFDELRRSDTRRLCELFAHLARQHPPGRRLP